MALVASHRDIRPSRYSFAEKCYRMTHSSTGLPTHKTTPKTIQWTQRLPSRPCEYEDFLETSLEDAVSRLLSGSGSAAEEVELGYNYDSIEHVLPGTIVHVQAQTLNYEGKTWIQASISGQSASGDVRLYAYGKWVLAKTKKHHYLY
ncbi:hypothetical protein CB0940_06388 [Cercospora beticola]|uniref:Thioesterase domain-containing protein n=1 Tax=Cercospora beticola TaxID=122368 RepID=A0A2G5HYA6_CERBT|nr:hypothetical protein CB0940_06388 [Cercospora beticola]PIA97544.1 hypothetical protein CB0940_06388 [Cercospora beticola]WPA99017.1 hypothetical protein RHO25_003631 [Cercospora beticola]CAK1360323.1 unnamed protein product [Cercospora beticola]